MEDQAKLKKYFLSALICAQFSGLLHIKLSSNQHSKCLCNSCFRKSKPKLLQKILQRKRGKKKMIRSFCCWLPKPSFFFFLFFFSVGSCWKWWSYGLKLMLHKIVSARPKFLRTASKNVLIQNLINKVKHISTFQ